RETKYFTDTTTMTRNVPEADISSYMDEALGDNVMVNSDVRRGSEEGYYDIEVTIRTMKAVASDLLIGGSGGLFKTEVMVRRNVKEENVESVAAGLNGQVGISSVRATQGAAEGYWDIVYTRLEIPPTRTETTTIEERKEVAWSLNPVSYTVETVYEREIVDLDGNGQPVVGYIQRAKTFPQIYGSGNTKLTRQVVVTRVISYGFDSPPSEGSTVFLPNGLWQNTVETQEYPWWGDIHE
ncbi:MAG: hypothetical protein PHP93_03390, partial [Kiritimatiellales bacterium]|nr:hypothetical protein [Kiritimatiellales bacterium]